MANSSSVSVERLFAGDPVAIARSISLIENEAPGAEQLLREIYPRTGQGYRIGITGPPGAGKSTLTNKLAQFYRRQGLAVGIIAVDPTSPFTGGALLGDRVRMTDVELDSGVFIRSMASRGSLGGLSRKAIEAADVLDAAGKHVILMETVGVGQSELDIAGAADTTVVVLVPESGDSIQAMKAGLMEIADFFVLNKADRAGADQAVMSLQMILGFRKSDGWKPEVLKTVANEGAGVPEVAGMIAAHRIFLEQSGLLGTKRRARIEERIRELIGVRMSNDFWTPERTALFAHRLDDVMKTNASPYDVVRELFDHFHSQAR